MYFDGALNRDGAGAGVLFISPKGEQLKCVLQLLFKATNNAAKYEALIHGLRIAVCNTRFIKEHKPSNHIRARIKSHVYTTEWTVYHSTYHVKRHNKANTNVNYYNNDIKVWYSGSEVQNTIKLSEAEAGRHRDVDWETKHLEVLVVLVALDELPRVGRNWAAVA